MWFLKSNTQKKEANNKNKKQTVSKIKLINFNNIYKNSKKYFFFFFIILESLISRLKRA